MNGRSPRGDDAGGAIVEFVGLTVLLLIPVVYLILTLGQIQAGAYAAESAARDAARSAVVSALAVLDEGGSASAAADAAAASARASAQLVVSDFGFDPGSDVEVALSCTSRPCLQPGSAVLVEVQIAVGLPGVPGPVVQVAPLGVIVSAEARSPVDGLLP